MTIITLLLYFAAAAVIMTLITGFVLKAQKNWLVTFLQHFAGVWFAFSGLVKAVDPIGTALKMEQYFTEFERTFAGTSLKFITPIFPFFSKYSVTFSIVVITLEIMLGIMLIIGSRRRWTAWIFLLIVVFFTVLTGFTYLTGYVAGDANFFDFAKWGEYKSSNMRVTDCGCFGEFMKLEPYTSFLKDLVLLVPISLLFVIGSQKMHKLFNRKIRFSTVMLSLFAILGLNYYNTAMDEPIVDFRPFKVGVNIPERREAEEKAASNVEILGYILKNEKTGLTAEKRFANTSEATKRFGEVMKEFPAEDGWKVKDQIKTDVTVPHTKLSDFSVSKFEDGAEYTEDILTDSDYSFMIVSYKLTYDNMKTETTYTPDTLYSIDTIRAGKEIKIVKTAESVTQKEQSKQVFSWNPDFVSSYVNRIKPFAEAAKKANIKTFVMTSPNDPVTIADFQKATQMSAFPFYYTDDVVLKTIMRSNPGVVLLHKGVVVDKWHIKKLPSFEVVKNKDIK